MTIKCPFCDRQAADIEETEAAEWTPGFWPNTHPEVWQDTPVCPECAAVRLREDAAGEMELVTE